MSRSLPALLVTCCIALTGCRSAPAAANTSAPPPDQPYLVVLGIAQDGGIPQTGANAHPAWEDRSLRRRVVCLGLVDPHSGRRWMFEATPDFPRQLHHLQRLAPAGHGPLDGIFLTHAHVGHYTGLMFLGHEAMGADRVPVYAMPRMGRFLTDHGPWSQLLRYENIELRPLAAGEPVRLTPDLTVTPLPVPHRQEYSEVVAFRIEGPGRSALFLPDVDSWEEWDAEGTRIEDVLAEVDVAWVDATFYADGEIPGRDMSGFPHPFTTHTMQRLAPLPAAERAKVRFIHLNHTNPAQYEDSEARRAIRAAGFRVAAEGDVVPLGR